MLAAGVHASIGPSTTLTIANKMISPDGFTRNSVLVNGVFPGPTISGLQVRQGSIVLLATLTPRFKGRQLPDQRHQWTDRPLDAD